MQAYVLAFASIAVGATNAQIFINVSCNATNTPTSYQFNALTGEMCATGNTTFDAEFCYLDPERVVTQLTAVREVEWQSKGGEKKRERVVVDTCQGDNLKHSINGIGNSSTLEFESLFARNFSVVDSEEDFITVPCLIFTWNLTVEGQEEGAKVTFTVCFFNQPATVLYQGQRAKVINGTLKISYEFENWTFCETEWEPYNSSGNPTQCQQKRANYTDGGRKGVSEKVLEIQFNITSYGKEDICNVNCSCKNEVSTANCRFGNAYSVTYFETTTVDDRMSCLPNEYPRINDFKDPDNSVIYSEHCPKKDKDKKKEKKKKKQKKKKKDKEEKACNKSAIIFAVPRFEVKAFYDPFDCLFCDGTTTTELAFSLLICVLFNFVHGGI